MYRDQFGEFVHLYWGLKGEMSILQDKSSTGSEMEVDDREAGELTSR